MNKLTKNLMLLLSIPFFLSGCMESIVKKDDVVNNPSSTREDVLEMIAESPTQEEGLSIVDPKNSGIKRVITEIQGNQKGVKFIDSKWEDFPISLNVNVIPIKKFFSLLEELTDLNFVIGDEVTGDLTMRVKNVNWIEVFDMVLREKNLIHDVNPSGTVITVHTYEFANNQSQAYEAALQSKIQVINSLSGLESKTTAIFKLNYTEPATVATQLKEVIATLEAGGDDTAVDQRATFVIDTRTKSLIVQASRSDIEWITTTIDTLDKPTKQVMVEVFIVEAGDTFQEALGSRVSFFNKGIRSSLSKNNELDRISISGSGGTPPTATGEITTAAAGGCIASNTIAGATGGVVGVFAGNTTDLRIELEAMQTENLVKIISNPKLFIIDNESATITDGTQIPYQNAAQAGATPTTQFIQAALSLSVTPSIIPDGNVYMDINITKASPGTGSSPPPINEKALQTKLLIQDGGVAMIGGIIKATATTAQAGVPLFKDLPIVGNLFKSKTNSDIRDHLYIFIAPKVL